MTDFLLIRHGETDWVGKALAGRLSGVRLNDTGKAQARTIPARIKRVDHVYSSPLERCIDTASPLAQNRSLELRCDERLNEIEIGEWTGKSLRELEATNEWKRYNSFREVATPPGGESMLAVQARSIAALDYFTGLHPNSYVAVFTHADVIRAVLTHMLGMPLSHIERLTIAPASITHLRTGADWTQVVSINNVE